MDNKEVAQKLNEVTEVKTMLSELKAFVFGKEEKKEEVKVEVPVVETPAAEVKEEVKVEFNHEEFTKNFNDYKTSIEEKFKSSEAKLVEFEAQIKSANETIARQEEILTKTFALVEKLAEAPVALSKQAKKEGVKKEVSISDYEKDMNEWRAKYIKQ